MVGGGNDRAGAATSTPSTARSTLGVAQRTITDRLHGRGASECAERLGQIGRRKEPCGDNLCLHGAGSIDLAGGREDLPAPRVDAGDHDPAHRTPGGGRGQDLEAGEPDHPQAE